MASVPRKRTGNGYVGDVVVSKRSRQVGGVVLAKRGHRPGHRAPDVLR
jgi:hypothetical protein